MAKEKKNTKEENENISADEKLDVIELCEKLQKENAELKQQLEEANAQIEKSKDAHLRACAEYENYRKRTAKQISETSLNAKADVISELLPVLDNYERAAQSTGDAEAYAKGLEMILSQLSQVIEKLDVKPFGEPGETFDPNVHNAVMHAEDEEKGEKEITDVFIKGYKLGDKVIRPASVKVVN